MTDLQDPDAERRRIIRSKNLVLGLLLGGLVVLFYLITISRIQH